jgi:hypothetical protein
MRWLISFQYKAWFPPINDGCFRVGTPVDAITLIDKHPAVFAAEMIMAHNAWRDSRARTPDERSDELITIYSAIAVDDDLTDEQINALS